MADLTNIPLDPNVKASGVFETVPDDWYPIVFLDAQVGPTKNGTGQKLGLKVQIFEGKYKGFILPNNHILNLLNQSEVAQRIGQGELRSICEILGAAYPPSNTNFLIGQPLMAKIVEEPFVSNTTGKELKGNKIKGFKAYTPILNQTTSTPKAGW